MVEKLLSKARTTRNNWYEAFRVARGVKGHEYYKIPAELKYRYPAPGSCPLDEVDHPNLYKKHWKTPFRDSPFNIRSKEKTYTTAENTEHFIEGIPNLDPENNEHDRMLALNQLPNMDDLKLMEEKDSAPDSDEMISEMWADFDGAVERMRLINRDIAPGHNNLDDEYD